MMPWWGYLYVALAVTVIAVAIGMVAWAIRDDTRPSRRVRIPGSWRHVRCAWADCKRSADRRLTVQGQRTGMLYAFCSSDHRERWVEWASPAAASQR